MYEYTHRQKQILFRQILPEQSIIFLLWTLQNLELWKKLINQIQLIKTSLFNNTWKCFNQTFKKENGRDQLRGTELNRNG